MLVSFLQHDDDCPEDIPTEDLPIGKSSVGIFGVCHGEHDEGDDEDGDDYKREKTDFMSANQAVF